MTTDVMISYSRQDSSFVQQLFAALEQNNHDTWVDWAGIEFSADWWKEICEAIESADTFLFVITPHSLSSAICQLEIAHAREHNKRIVPILRERPDLDQVMVALAKKELDDNLRRTLNGREILALARDNWNTLARHHWLMFDITSDFDGSFQRLIDTLKLDLEHVRRHTRLLIRAKEWDTNERKVEFLMRGEELRKAEEWLADSERKASKPTELQVQFIISSVAQRQYEEDLARERQEHERLLEQRAARVLRQFVAVMTVASIISIGLAVLAYRAQQDAVEQRDQADIARQEAIVQRNQAERQADENFSLQLAARASLFPGLGDEPLRGLPFIMEANELSDPPSEVLITLAEIAYAPGARRILPHEGWARAVDYSPDGTHIITTEADGSVILWDAAMGERLREFDTQETEDGTNTYSLYDLHFSPDGKYVIGGGEEYVVYIWEVATGKIVHRLVGHRNRIFGTVILPGDEFAVSASEDMRVLIWNLENDTVETELTGHSTGIINMDVSDDGKWAVTVDFAGDAFVWNLETRSHQLTFDKHENLLAAVSISPDNQTVLTANQDILYLWNVETGEVMNSLPNPFGVDLIYRVLFSHDGSRFVVSKYGDEFTLIETNTLKQVFENHITGHTGVISGLSFSPDDSMLATSSEDHWVIIWDVTGRGAEMARVNPGGALLVLDLSADGSTALYALEDGTLVVWDVATQAERFRFTPTQPDIFTETLTADLSSDGQWIVTGDSSGAVILWDAATGEQMRRFEGHQAPVRAVVFSPDGQRIAAAGGNVQITIDRPVDNSVMVWDTAAGSLLYRLDGHTAPVRALAFSPDGNRLLSGGDDSFIYLWDAAAGAQIRVLIGAHRNGLLSLAFSPIGTQALSGDRDGLLVLWNLDTGVAVRTMRGRAAPVEAVAFSADEQLAVSTSSAQGEIFLLVWSLERGEVVRSYGNHAAPITNMVLRSDLNSMISADTSGTLIYWEFLSPEALIDWVYANYDVYCYEGEGFEVETRCIESEVVTTDASAETEVTQTQLPVPAQTIAQASEICTVTNPRPIPAEIIDTSAYLSDETYVIGFSNAALTGNPLDAFVGAWAQYEASLHSDEIEQFVYRDAGDNAAQQLADLQELIGMGVDVLIVNPSELADQAAITTLLNESGIPIIFVNKRLPDVDYVSFVGPDDFKVGCLMAQEFIALMNAEGEYPMQDGVTGGASREARKAARDLLLSLYPNLTQTVNLPTDFKLDSINSNMNTNTAALDGILAYNGYIAYHAELFLSEKKLPLLPAVGDHNIGLARLLYEENVPGVLVRVPGQMGSQAILTALSMLQGESVSQFIEIRSELIRSDQLGEYDLSYPDEGMLGDYDGLPEEFHPVFATEEAESEP